VGSIHRSSREPGSSSDESLGFAAGRGQSGAEWAWDRIYKDLAPKVRGYLVSLGSDDPDNLLGEVWLQVARNIGTLLRR